MDSNQTKASLRDPEKTRGRILDAALNVFARKGYYEAKLDEIVDESHTSKGSIYFHFPNKERLFLALVDQFADLLERRVTESIQDKEMGMARVRVALVTVLDTFARYRRPAKILLVQAVGLGQPFEEKRLEINDRFASLIETYIKEAIIVGDIEATDTEVVAHAWMGAIYQLVIRWVYTGEPEQSRIVTGLVPLLLQSVGYVDEA
ncbi:MAG: TetR/AcrR family transcriptional regulator [Anaerolineales bacterium]|nr:TetR/AcrR family transcriptional regulator [Anaerolineales bacterium]MCB0009413.1 TetR/AcrR family transcriptional regulator [Anaerolineales bacterium]MCB0020210.1 TetR/AcrR family transcriptional regulator [Anaerolineales bacterium]MCB0028826.1 TetR/AcrR family transcriptional regulator [Anaerolineales bacterium]MCB8963375.1 TetR/AcrR family transcriptional regulator [Ardenticatenales bacterium]